MTQGIDLFYSFQGEGDPVILVHGGPGLDHAYLETAYMRLSKNLGVAYYDQRCLGQSGGFPTPATVTLAAFLSDLDALRRGLGFETVHLVGHSWGAFLAMIYSYQRPQNVKSLVLMNPSPATYEGMREVVTRAWKRQSPEDREALGQLAVSEPFLFGEEEPVNVFMKLWFKGFLGDPSQEDLLDFRLGPRTAKNWARLNALMLRHLGAFDIRVNLRDIAAPTLVMVGEKDVVPEECVGDILRNISNSQKKVIPGTGHFSILEAPEEVYSSVTAFLGCNSILT